MKKHCFALTLALSLFLWICTAQAENRSFFVPETENNGSIDSVCCVGETLYGHYRNQWMRYTLGAETFTAVCPMEIMVSPSTGEEVYLQPISDGETLYGFSFVTGDLWKMTPKADGFDMEFLSTLDFSIFPEYGVSTIDTAMTKGYAAIGYSKENSDGMDTLAVWSLTDGKLVCTLDTAFVAPYDQERLLYVEAGEDSSGDGSEAETVIRTLNTATGEDAVLYTLTTCALLPDNLRRNTQ